jgi:hypothetical protein
MKLRRFTSEGMQVFREFLAESRREPKTQIPPGLLEHRTWTEVVTPECQVAENRFETKGEVATYLRGVLGKLPPEELLKDTGLWTWLSLLYLDSICSFRDGHRVIKNDYYYVFEAANMRHFYRHLLFVSWRVLLLAPSHNRLFLKSRLNGLDRVTERVMSRLYLIRIPCFFEVLDRLYWDEAQGRPRSGITDSRNTKPGNLNHRLPIRIRQLEKTYDLMSLTATQLLELLGDEFAFARMQTQKLFPEEVGT